MVKEAAGFANCYSRRGAGVRFFGILRFITLSAAKRLPGVYVKLLLYRLAARAPLQTDPRLMELYCDGVAIQCVI